MKTTPFNIRVKLLNSTEVQLELACFSSFLNGYCCGNSHTNHRVVACADETHHLNVKLSYEEAFPINILGDEHIILMHSCTHYTRKIIKSQASYNNFESSFYQV